MITNEVYMEIEVLRKHGLSLRRIATEVGWAVNTVRSHLAAEAKPKYERQKQRLAKVAPPMDPTCGSDRRQRSRYVPATVLVARAAKAA